MTYSESLKTENLVECACGCGTKMTERNKWRDKRKFVYGHYTRKANLNKTPTKNLSETIQCGCGTTIGKYGSNGRDHSYIRGHTRIGKKFPSEKGKNVSVGFREKMSQVANKFQTQEKDGSCLQEQSQSSD